MAEEKREKLEAQIKSADMSEDMQQEAIEVATTAMEQFHVEKDIAQYIKKEFDSRKGATWHCIRPNTSYTSTSDIALSSCSKPSKEMFSFNTHALFARDSGTIHQDMNSTIPSSNTAFLRCRYVCF
ncbi:Dynein light chain [Myotisia sp. PD_48]|nr:Dynein light chain [Myotisia sp. PD_48]